MNDFGDDEPVSDLGTDNNLFIKLRSKGFSKQAYDFTLTLREFFEGLRIAEPLFRLTDKRSNLLFIKMQTSEDKERFLKLQETEKDQFVIYKSVVTASALKESFTHEQSTRLFTRTKEEALDVILPYRNVPYETQLQNKMKTLKSFVASADSSSEDKLKCEKRIEEKYFSNIPSFDEPIKAPKEIGVLNEYVLFDVEYDVTNKQIEVGMKVFFSPGSYYFLPIKDCAHIAPEIIAVAENFVTYLNANIDDLKEFKYVNEESKTGFINKLQCSVGDKGELLLTVLLSYYSDNEEFVPLDEIFQPISLKERVNSYRSQQNGGNQTDEQMQVDPQEEDKSRKKKPDWSSETGNPNGFKFVAIDFQDCHRSFGNFDIGQADSHLKVAVPFLTKFYEENKKKLNIHGIYINWFIVTRRPIDWTRRSRVYHHVCGEIRITKSVAGFPIHKFPFSWSFGPTIPNCNSVLELLAKHIDPQKNLDLAVSCNYRSISLFFAKKCRNIIGLLDYSDESKGPTTAKETKTRIIPTGQNLSQIDFAYRKCGGPPAALIIFNCNSTKSPVITRYVELGVKKIALVIEKAKTCELPGVKNSLTPELKRINILVYPYLSLKRIIPVDCDPGGMFMSIIALYEENTEAPPRPPPFLQKLPKELESQLPRTAIPPTHSKSKKHVEDYQEPDAKRRKLFDDDFNAREPRGADRGRGRGRNTRGRGRGGGRGGGRPNTNDPEKAALLKQIEELRAQQEKLKKLIPGGSAKFSSRARGERGRQTGSRRGPNDSRREDGRYDQGGDRYSGSRDRYGSWDYRDSGDRYDASRGHQDASRGFQDASRGRQDASRDRYGGSDNDRFGYGSGPSRTAESEKYVGSGYDYRNYSSTPNYNTRYDAGGDIYERRDSANRGGSSYSSGGTTGYRSAYEDIKAEPTPPPPPPPVISRQ